MKDSSSSTGKLLLVVGSAAAFLLVMLFKKKQKKRRGMNNNQPRYFSGSASLMSPNKPLNMLDSAASLLSFNSNTSHEDFLHPEGLPNIGPQSDSCWLEGDNAYPAKTDLLHTGHLKGGKLIIVMVGLPASGKTFTARKVARYLRWINYRTRVFCLARYRHDRYGHKQAAEFFDSKNPDHNASRMQLLHVALEDAMGYLNRGGEVALLDGTNVTKERRSCIRDRVSKEDGFDILWIECICDDPNVKEHNLEELRERSPDFVADHDFQRRVEFYQKDYLTVEEGEGMYAKTFNAGRKIELHEIHGFLPTKIIAFLMNLHIVSRPVYICRHGESVFNVNGLIGGDSGLSEKGEKFSEVLALFIANEEEISVEKLSVWSSTMKRSRLTARKIPCARYVEWRALREIEVGICDGLSYDQVKEKFPHEYRAREQDKLHYRYPRGESYLDVLSRLEPAIFELERQKSAVLIIAHQAVLRCLYAYFLDLPAEEVPYLAIPLHTVIKLVPKAFGCTEKRYKVMVDD